MEFSQKTHPRDVGVSCSVLFCYLLKTKFIDVRYNSNENIDALSGIIINRIRVRRVTRM